MKKIIFLCAFIALKVVSMDEKNQDYNKMSLGLFSLTYGIKETIKREKKNNPLFNVSTQTTLITIMKQNNRTELGTDNFTLYKNPEKSEISIHFKSSYAYIHNKKDCLIFPHSNKHYKELLNTVNAIIFHAKPQDANKYSFMKYFDVSQSLIHDIEEIIKK